MKRLLIVALLIPVLFVGTMMAQNADSASIQFTDKGSRLVSVAGNLSVETQENEESVTTAEVGMSFLPFATDNFAPGIDWKVTHTSQAGSESTTQLAVGPKFVAAFTVPDVPIYPYFGFGYNLLVSFRGDNNNLGHLLKVGLGVIVEPVEHFGVPLEFTINFPLGEDSDFKVYGFSIGMAILGY